jgi:hypothetical protein
MTLAFDLNRPLAAIVLCRAGMDLYPLPDSTKTESAEQFAAAAAELDSFAQSHSIE